MFLRFQFSTTLPAIVITLTGLGAMYTGSQYRVGTLTAMGPGFMPLLLGVVMAGLGMLVLWFTLRHRSPPAAVESGAALRPVLCVGAGIVVWALLIDTVGFFPAGMAQLLLSSLALPQPGWRRVVIGSMALCLAAYGLFVQLLGLPLPAFGF